MLKFYFLCKFYFPIVKQYSNINESLSQGVLAEHIFEVLNILQVVFIKVVNESLSGNALFLLKSFIVVGNFPEKFSFFVRKHELSHHQHNKMFFRQQRVLSLHVQGVLHLKLFDNFFQFFFCFSYLADSFIEGHQIIKLLCLNSPISYSRCFQTQKWNKRSALSNYLLDVHSGLNQSLR